MAEHLLVTVETPAAAAVGVENGPLMPQQQQQQQQQKHSFSVPCYHHGVGAEEQEEIGSPSILGDGPSAATLAHDYAEAYTSMKEAMDVRLRHEQRRADFLQGRTAQLEAALRDSAAQLHAAERCVIHSCHCCRCDVCPACCRGVVCSGTNICMHVHGLCSVSYTRQWIAMYTCYCASHLGAVVPRKAIWLF